MANSNCNPVSYADRVQSIREALEPIEQIARALHIDLDVITLPATAKQPVNRLSVQATLLPVVIATEDPSTGVLAKGFIEFAEGYSARLLKLAADLRAKFPAT